MSDNIDYAELDRAVNEAIKNRPKASKTPAKSTSLSKPTAKTASSAPVRPRGQFMDFVATKQPRPTTARPLYPTATKPVATSAPRPAVRPIAQSPSKPIMRKVTAAQQPVATARKAVTAPKPATKPVAKPAPKPTPKPVAKPAPKPVAKPAPKLVEKLAPKPADAPNANNYSLGVRSPFLVDTKVEKRPLGTDIPETSARALHSTKNVYSSKSPSKTTTSTHKKHLIAEAPKKHSGWLWTLVVLLVIAAGGGLGYLAYILIFANQL